MFGWACLLWFGNPVHSKLPCSAAIFEHCILFPLKNAPSPRAAENNSSKIGLYTTPSTSSLPFASAIETQKHGYPCAKFVVPSSGSTCHLYSEPVSFPVPSSAATACPGKYFCSRPTITASDRLSACVTRSYSPLYEISTGRCTSSRN